MSNTTGTIFNIQRYSIDDGPGIRTTVFMKGCPLKCLWCSNPESQHPWPEVTHRDASCIKCGSCVQVCAPKAISIDDQGVYINRQFCTRCTECSKVCPSGALKVMGQEVSVEEVFEEIERDTDYYQNSGGGVTISGGEILAQPEFAAALLKRCHDAGFHTCIDTSGCGTLQALEKILPYTSLALFDLKHMDSTAHQELTGESNELIIRNLQLVAEKGTPFIIRVPVIPGLNDSDEQFTAMARTVAGISKTAPINLMPYHRFGLGKYKMLDMEYQLSELRRPPDSELEKAKEIFESCGLKCEIVV